MQIKQEQKTYDLEVRYDGSRYPKWNNKICKIIGNSNFTEEYYLQEQRMTFHFNSDTERGIAFTKLKNSSYRVKILFK